MINTVIGSNERVQLALFSAFKPYDVLEIKIVNILNQNGSSISTTKHIQHTKIYGIKDKIIRYSFISA